MAKIIELELSDEDYAVLIEAGKIIGDDTIALLKNTLVPEYISSINDIAGQIIDGKSVVERILKFHVLKGNKTVK